MASPKGGEQESLPLCLSKRKSDTGNFHSVAISARAVTAMLYVFVMTGFQAEKLRTLTQQAQSLAVTVGQGADEWDPYTRLYAYDQVTLPFAAFSFGSRSVVQRVVVRDWVGYTGESFSGGGEIFVYVTPKGEDISQKQGLSVSERKYPEYRCRDSLMLRETGMGAGIQPVYTV